MGNYVNNMHYNIHNPADIVLGQRIKTAREAASMTQEALAKALNVSVEQLRSYELGEKRLQATNLYKCALVLNVLVTEFFEGLEDVDMRAVSHGQTSALVTKRAQPLSILLVEDNPADEYLIREAIEASDIEVELHHESDGERALEYLANGFMRQQETVLPDIIVLDLNLPRLSGFDILNTLKEKIEFRHIPVVVTTNSINVEDMQLAYEQHASGFISKSLDMHIFSEHVKYMLQYWSFAAILPSMQV